MLGTNTTVRRHPSHLLFFHGKDLAITAEIRDFFARLRPQRFVVNRILDLFLVPKGSKTVYVCMCEWDGYTESETTEARYIWDADPSKLLDFFAREDLTPK